MKEKAIICDIDGVILDSSQVFKEIEEQGLTGDAKWEYFDRHANGLHVYPEKRMIKIIHSFYQQGYKIIFSTARSERIKMETSCRLVSDFQYYEPKGAFEAKLLMRPIGDYSPSAEIKEKHLEDIKKEYDIVCSFDDDDSNCAMFERNKILTFKVVNESHINLLEEYNTLKRDNKDCEREYKRMAQQYKAVVKQNDELQSALMQKCKDCDSEARLELAKETFEKLSANYCIERKN